MLASFTFEIDGFEALSPSEQQDVYLDALRALVNIDVAYLATHRLTPRLYASGVRFAISDDERAGLGNVWPNIPAVLAKGTAHCVGLACWRIAELRVRDGVDAVPVIREFREWLQGHEVQEFHVCVGYPDGSVEDPSRELGMP